MSTRLPRRDVVPPDERGGSGDLDRVRSEIGELNETLQRHEERTKQVEAAISATPAGDALSARIDAIAAQLVDLDTRITAVSTELANQLSELGNDIDILQRRPPGAAIDDEQIDDLRTTQTRLASEQARYQIAFREDLARLAEQLRRPGDDVRRRG